ncbi:MAG: DUF6184 family natural product biosynthesis lipoprotein [Polyangiales bacterium]
MASNHPIRNTACAAALLTAGIVACSHHHAPAAYGGGPGAVQASIDSAVERVSQEQCARSQRCDNIGTGREYASRENCLTVERGKFAEAFSLQSCPGGIDEHNLQSCLSEIRDQGCGASWSSVSRRETCRNRNVCYH